MEIDIQSKTNNPILKRTEVHFFLHHEEESTPKRELVRSELADKLKVKKENIMINYMKSSFGKSETVGYARIYNSIDEAKKREKEYILKRNNIITKKPEKKKEEGEKPPEKPQSKPLETTEKPKEMHEKAEEKPEEPKKESAQEKPREPKIEKKSEKQTDKIPDEKEEK